MTRNASSQSKKEQTANYVSAAVFSLVIVIAVFAAAFLSYLIIGKLNGDRNPLGPEVEVESQLSASADQFDPVVDVISVEISQESQRELVPSPTATENPIRPKPVHLGSSSNRQWWTPTPRPSPTPSPTPSPFPTFVSNRDDTRTLQPLGLGPNERWIDVNLTEQSLVAYVGQLPVFDTRISSGLPRYPTVTGQFRIWLRFRSQDMNGRRLGYDYYLKDVPYVQYFFEDYALHGTFWHNNFGSPMSHGCVNLPTPAAEWLYNWADYGTLVNIHY